MADTVEQMSQSIELLKEHVRVLQTRNITVGAVANLDVRDYGAVGNARVVMDGKCTGNNIVTSATANFQSTDVGKKLSLINDTTSSTVIRGTTIVEVMSATQVRVSANAVGNVQNGVGVLTWGTDDTAAIQAALNAAANLTGPDLYVSENQPIGLGFAVVSLPVTGQGDGGYMIADTINVPRQVVLDAPAMLVSAISDPYKRLIYFQAGSHCYRLYAQCNLGNGILVGATGERSQALFSGYVRLWRVGTLETANQSQRQIGMEFRGYGMTLTGQFWVKGGNRGVFINNGNDVLANQLFLIGAKTGLVMVGGAQLVFNHVEFDTCADKAIQINTCQLVQVANAQAWINNSNPTAKFSYGIDLGNASGTTPNSGVTINYHAQNTGDTAIVRVANTCDARINVTGSNSYIPTGNSTPIQNLIVYGSNITGYLDVRAHMSSNISIVAGGNQYGRLSVDLQGEQEERLHHDLSFQSGADGVILIDRTTGQRRRLLLSGGELSTEIVS